MKPAVDSGQRPVSSSNSEVPGAHDPRRRERRRLFQYETMMQVTIRHGYYAGRDATGEIVRAVPTSETSARMQERGILHRPERDGFSVLYDRAPRRELQAVPRGGDWLSFVLVSTGVQFANITDVDFDASPLTASCYYSNRLTQRSGPADVSANGRGLTPQQLPAFPAVLREALDPGQTIEVLDAGGRQVLCRTAPSSGGPGCRGNDVAIPYDSLTRQVYVSLSGLPDGRYSVRIDGREIHDRLLLGSRDFPLGFVDLFLHDGDMPGACPMAQSATEPVTFRQYEIAFGARRTFWKYHIVSRAGSGPLDNLSIAPASNGNGAPMPPGTRFLGPFEETLPNGVRSLQFLSTQPIPLTSRSGLRLRLNGRRKDRMTRDAVLVDCLPVGSTDRLALLTDQDLARLAGVDDPGDGLCSEMFVYV